MWNTQKSEIDGFMGDIEAAIADIRKKTKEGTR